MPPASTIDYLLSVHANYSHRTPHTDSKTESEFLNPENRNLMTQGCQANLLLRGSALRLAVHLIQGFELIQLVVFVLRVFLQFRQQLLSFAQHSLAVKRAHEFGQT